MRGGGAGRVRAAAAARALAVGSLSLCAAAASGGGGGARTAAAAAGARRGARAMAGGRPARAEYRRADGVRIAHDPYAPGMAAHYGRPGETDDEGFDPYADTVGPGIYGGRVQRDAAGAVVVGRQYQGHNPRPGPVYAGGGYTEMASAIQRGPEAAAALLDARPELLEDVSTGGARPLHLCGMSRRGQASAALLVARGAEVDALDTYGYTPLMRMASNNLPEGAVALLDGGADPDFVSDSGETAQSIARVSDARDVLDVLKAPRPRAECERNPDRATASASARAAKPAPTARRRGESPEEKRARKAAAREAKAAKRQGGDAHAAAAAKPCQGCGAASDLLVRCQTAESAGSWVMLCGKCWRSASGGVVDGDAAHPHYRYGGLWKSAARRRGDALPPELRALDVGS